MKQAHVGMVVVLMLICCRLFGQAQQTGAAGTNAVVPTLVSFSGMLTGSNGKPLTSITGVTFSLYGEQQGGAPLWLETQNVQPDKNGNYSVQLGSTTSQGLPTSVFVSGQARWLEVQPQGQEAQPRIMLLSVPYALKAGDAQTLNGQPASAFLTASGGNATGANGIVNNALSGTGTKNYLPLWLSSSKLGSSKIFQSTAGDLGIGTTSPTATLDVNGNATVTASGTTITASGGSTGVSGAGSTYGVYGTSSTGTAVYGDDTSSGFGVYGDSAEGIGVAGVSSGTSAGDIGVYGIANGSTGNQTYGVLGNNTGSTFGVGVYGQDSTTGARSNTGSGLGGAGVWGDGGIVNSSGDSNLGVLGTTDDNYAGLFENYSSESYTVLAENANSVGSMFQAFNLVTFASCTIDYNGNLNCTGAKHAVVPVDGGRRKVALSAIESPKNWFEDFGSAQLSNGSAVVTIDPEYRQTVNTELEYHVFLTPNGDCKGLYIGQRTPASFEVRELGGGTSNIEFSYRIIALRKNYENIRMEDHTNDPDPRKMMAKRRTSGAPSRFEAPKLSLPQRPSAPTPIPAAQMGKPQITEQR